MVTRRILLVVLLVVVAEGRNIPVQRVPVSRVNLAEGRNIPVLSVPVLRLMEVEPEGKVSFDVFNFTYSDENNYEYTYGDPFYEYGGHRPAQDDTDDGDDEHVPNAAEEDEASSEEGGFIDTSFVVPVTPARPPPDVVIREPSVLDKIRSFWQKAKEEIVRVVEVMEEFIVRVDALAKKGIKYCMEKFDVLKERASDLGDEAAEVVEKLEKMMKRGNKLVKSLFSLLGDKVSRWNEEHEPYVPDAVIVNVGSDDTTGPVPDVIAGPMPNFFEDDDVEELLEQLVKANLLTLEDLTTIRRASYAVEPSRDK